MLDPEPGSQVSAELIRILYLHTEVYVYFSNLLYRRFYVRKYSNIFEWVGPCLFILSTILLPLDLESQIIEESDPQQLCYMVVKCEIVCMTRAVDGLDVKLFLRI